MKKIFTFFCAALMSVGMWADPNILTPTISGDLFFTESTTVTMECTSPDADIYYTTDGVTDPRCDCAAAPEYKHPITITETTVIKAAAYDGNDWSAVAEVTFTKKDPEPQAPETAPEAPEQAEENVLALYCSHYTTNNANFNLSGWPGAYQTLEIEGTKIGLMPKMTWECLIDPVNTDSAHNFSAYENIHIDIWAPAAAKVKFTAEAVTGGNYKEGHVVDLVAGWNYFDFPIAMWPGEYDFSNLKCFVFENYTTPEGASFEGNPFAFTNVYFWNEASQAIDNTAVDAKAVKVIRDGQMLILKNGKTYNALGAEVK